MKHFFTIILFFFLFGAFNTSWAQNCDHEEQKISIQKIEGKIQNISQKHSISIAKLSYKIHKLIEKHDLNEEKKCIILSALENLQAQTHKAEKNKKLHFQNIKNLKADTSSIQKYSHLYPYYKNTYIPSIDESVLSGYIFKKDTTEKVVYLTFDDGPYNNGLLYMLKSQNIAASFFLLCSKMNAMNIKAYKDELFSIGGHSWKHDNFDKMTLAQIQNDFNKCDKTFGKLDIESRIFRPAYGIINEKELQAAKEHNLDIYIWNIDSLDWDNGFTTEKIEKIIKDTQGGDIILFHEGVNRTRLQTLIDGLKDRGFSFGKL